MSSFSLWQCCCCSNPSKEERKPFARSLNNPKQVKVLKKGDKLVVKHVNVPNFDNKFSLVTDLYNDQVENYEIMTHCASKLIGTNASSSLTGFIQALKEINSNCDISVKMEGYNFSLILNEKEDLPESLKEAQELIRRLSRATKLVIGNQTKFSEMAFSILQIKTQMAEEIKQTNLSYLDQVRLEDNFEENIQNIDTAKQLSMEYAEEANNVLREIACIAGLNNL
ncbi:uncharacterized protein RCH25_049733 [Pelodytes ibericus]